jgi:hypothetical protein
MRLSKYITYVLAALLVVPAGIMAAQQPSRQGSGSAAMSRTGNFPREASQLLSDVRAKSEDVAAKSDTQAIFNESYETNWFQVGDNLWDIRSDINAMGKDLYRLQAIRRMTDPWQRREISRITPKLQDMAAQTTAADNLLNNNQDSYWATNLPNDVETIHKDARQVHRSVVREIQEARTQQELGTTSTSGS